MYYDNFERLLKEKGVKPSDVSKATKISTATLTNWKQGTYTPKSDKLQKIADYFGVNISVLMYDEDNSDEMYTPELASLVGQIRNDKDLSNALLKYFTQQNIIFFDTSSFSSAPVINLHDIYARHFCDTFFFSKFLCDLNDTNTKICPL